MAGKQGEPKRWWNPDNLRDVAESVGIAQLNNEAVQALQEEVEYRVYMVIQEAKRFMLAGKRTVLYTTDISQALKVLEVEPLYGYESVRPLRFGEASLGPGQPLFYIEDEEVDFEKLINAPLPKVPRDMSFTAHWLAVEGVQPSIPQNPTTAESRSHELYPKGNPTIIAMAGVETPGFKPMTKHVVSKEQRAWFDQVMQEILNEDDTEEAKKRRYAAYQSIRDEPGTQQLLVYMVSFISEKITHNVKSLFVGRVMMETLKAIIDNERFFLQPYLSALIPPIATVACADRPVSEIGEENIEIDYELRRMSGQLLALLCNKYDKSPDKDMILRAANTMLAVIVDPKKPLTAHYGAIVGFCATLPPDGIRTVFAPDLKTFDLVLERGRQEGNIKDLEMVIGAIMEGFDKLAKNPPPLMMTMMNRIGAGDEDIDMEGRREKLVAIVGDTIADRILNSGNEILEKALTWNPRKELGF